MKQVTELNKYNEYNKQLSFLFLFYFLLKQTQSRLMK